MTKFDMPHESIKRFTTLIGQSKDIISVTNCLFVIDDASNTLKTTFFSAKNAMSFSVDIENYVAEAADENYFKLDVYDFISTLEKLNDEGSIHIEFEEKKVTFRNSNWSRISLTNYNVEIKDAELEDAKSMLDTLDKQYFLAGTNDIIITSDVIDFFEGCSRMMNMTASSNAIAVDATSMKYEDDDIHLQKSVTGVTSSKDNVYIQKELVGFIKPFVKAAQNPVVITMSSVPGVIKVDSAEFGFKAVLTMPEEPSFAFATPEEYETYSPEDAEVLEVTFNKKDLQNAIEMFKGTFKAANWRYGEVTFDLSDEYIAESKCHLDHCDETAECMTDIPVTVVKNTLPQNDAKFILSSTTVYEALNLAKEDVITMRCNGLSSDQQHGICTVMNTASLDAGHIKLVTD